MPRFIRPSWLDVRSDARSNTIGTGPNKRDGQLSANLKVRENGSILDLLDIEAIGSNDGQTVTVRITDNRTRQTIYEETFQQ